MSALPSPLRIDSAPIPAKAGIGLRAVHHQAVLDEAPAVTWFEAHSENYFADGGAQIEFLERIRARYPVSLHGVGLSLGSVDPLNADHLRKLDRLIRWSEPAFVSEHLSWSSVGGIFLNDLLPLPYTEEALRHMIARVGEMQDRLRRQVLIENISSYLRYDFETIPEAEFLVALAAATGCGLLLDVNNVYVSARNHAFDPYAFIRAIPGRLVREMHLAGHSVNRHGEHEILIDTHSSPVCPEVWDLYDHAVRCFGPRPTLIEWDADIPTLATLVAEADRANHYLEQSHVDAA
jgi:uncharacterized protein (UPF0276 family)